MPTRYYNHQDKIDTEKAIIFVEHIRNHLTDLGIEGTVICKICGKTIDEIYEEEGVEEER